MFVFSVFTNTQSLKHCNSWKQKPFITVGLLRVDVVGGAWFISGQGSTTFVSTQTMLQDSSEHPTMWEPPTRMDFLSTDGEEWGFASTPETRSGCLSLERRCEQLSLPQCVLVLSKAQLLCCQFPPSKCAGCLFAIQKLLRQHRVWRSVSQSVSIWPRCLLPHWASQIGWCLLSGFVHRGEVSHMDCTGAGQGDKIGDAALGIWKYFHPLSNRKSWIGTDFSNKDTPQEICLEFLLCLSMGQIQKSCPYPCPIPYNLGKQHGLCYCGFINSAGPSLIPKRAVL